MININITALFQLLSFLILLFALKKILFAPILGILDERQRGLENQAQEARQHRRQARDKMAQYQREIAAARKEAAQMQQQVEKEALELRTKMLSEKRAEAESELAKVNTQLERDMEEQSAALNSHIGPLRDVLLQKVTERQR